MDDTTLIAQIKEGNKLAFKQFFDRYYQSLYLYLINFTSDSHAAEDLAQLVFVDFWNKRNTIQIHSSPKSYLYKMGYNQFLTSLRKKKKEASILEQLKYEALQTITTPTEAELEQKNQRLWRVIDQLPERCQEVLKLKMEGLKYREIADALGLSVKTVESQMRVTFIKIREDYKEDLLLFLLMME
ncbi:RNA polymerase sigma factor [Gelidibacter maritimus]|uniref:RNA polymerase sigma-70 factor n=1 Tax=Gelidibacter maritimus TaxID=2761487 RepID=A0A7W2R3I5_9FLAO|nr:RNA polymerase sigma-70 factor [Gelidibacter maritimus]MBA6152050.1 RNA polymerase sigma-70 factor [Gelidibacter maritimus]